MAANAWVIYNKFKEFMADGTIDLDTDSFRCALVTSSYTPAATHETWTSVSANEVANGNGYTTHGDAMAVTWVESSGTVTWDSDDPAWTASGGSITARYAVIVHDANADNALASTDKLVAYCLLDNSPADVVQADGGTLTVQINASGVFTLASA